MLKLLSVKNFALIRKADIEFGTGLNLITGETGAGKSLLIGAIGALLGDRVGIDMIQRDAEKAIIEAEINIETDELKSKLAEIISEDNLVDSVIIRREISRNGKSRAFLNDSLVTMKKMAEFTMNLIDLCGQHEQGILLKREHHLDFLDRFAGTLALRHEYQEVYSEYQKLKARLNSFMEKREKSLVRRDRVDFEKKEIESINPQLGEDEALVSEEKTMQHGEQIMDLCFRAESEIMSDSGSVMEIIDSIADELESIAVYAKEFESPLRDLRESSSLLEEAARNLINLREKIDFTPERLDEIRNRLGELSVLKRKYGGSIESVLEHLKKLKSEKSEIDSLGEQISEIEDKIDRLFGIIKAKAIDLSDKRRQSVPKLKVSMEKILLDLGFNYIVFEPIIEYKKGTDINNNNISCGISQDGIDDCELYVSTNSGETPLPLKDIASGGELSRILLGLKSVIAGKDKPTTLIFDEIDLGISGRIARKVGVKLWETSQNQQLLVVTHLPQIASMPGTHFSIVKSEDNKQAVSEIFLLADEERVGEISKLLAMDDSVRRGENYARELLSMGKLSEESNN